MTKSDIRGRIREDLAANYDELWRALATAAMAEKQARCPHCKRELVLPDWTARVNAMRLMVEQGYGKAAAPEQAAPTVDSLPWQEWLGLMTAEERRVMAGFAARVLRQGEPGGSPDTVSASG